MIKRIVVTILVGLIPASVSAQSLRESIRREEAQISRAQAAAPQTVSTPTTSENKYFMPAIALWSAGGGLILLSETALHVDCDNPLESCSIGPNKGMLFAGLGAAALGTVLFFKGESARSPMVSFVPGGVMVGKRLKF